MQSNVVLLIVVGLVILLLLVWLLTAFRRTKVEIETKPTEEPARRNQALIDAPPVAAVPPVVPDMPAATPSVTNAGVAVPPLPIHTSETGGDDLTRLKGVGPKLAEQLRALGVTHFAQVAAWSEADIDRIDAQLGRFQGRIRRDSWTEQARLLAAGDTVGYEAKFGRL